MHTGVFLPIFDELADPHVHIELAQSAEEAGWDGVFLWDHLMYRAPIRSALDPWIAMAAMACHTERVHLGPMVTPVARRRPAKLAREVVTLDQLSGGRVIFGAGLGGDRAREFSAFGEETDPKARGAMLDEGLEVLQRLWSGEEVNHRGDSFIVDGVSFMPRPVNGRVPIWLAARWPNRRPARRAARYDGIFPIEMTDPAQLQEMMAEIAQHRSSAEPFDAAVMIDPGDDPTPWRDAGATWWLTRFDPFNLSLDEVRSVVRAGPRRP